VRYQGLSERSAVPTQCGFDVEQEHVGAAMAPARCRSGRACGNDQISTHERPPSRRNRDISGLWSTMSKDVRERMLRLLGCVELQRIEREIAQVLNAARIGCSPTARKRIALGVRACRSTPSDFRTRDSPAGRRAPRVDPILVTAR